MGLVTITGIVLSSSDVGEFDKRLVILTKESGRVTAFARASEHSPDRFRNYEPATLVREFTRER